MQASLNQEPPGSAAAPRTDAKAKAESPWVEEETDGTIWVNSNKKEISITSRGAAVLGLQLQAGEAKKCAFHIDRTLLRDASQPRKVVRLFAVRPKGKTGQHAYHRLVSRMGTRDLLHACRLDPRKLGRLKLRKSHGHVDILEAEARDEISSQDTIDVTAEEKRSKTLLQQKGGDGDKAAKQTSPPVPGQHLEAARAPVGAAAESAGCAAALRHDQVRRSKTPPSRSICMTQAPTQWHIKMPKNRSNSVVVRWVHPLTELLPSLVCSTGCSCIQLAYKDADNRCILFLQAAQVTVV